MKTSSIDDLREQLKDAESHWEACLKAHKKPRKTLRSEELGLARKMQEEGHEAVIMALLGATYEQPNKDYDPSRWISLERVFLPKNFGRYVSDGAAILEKRKRAALRERFMKHA